MIDDLKRAAAFAGITERLGKLVPRLASNHDGEVVATVAAIGRTLQSAGLDWHDLAQRIATPTIFDASGAEPPRSARTADAAPARPQGPPVKPDWYSDREWEQAKRRAAGETPKPRREPSPWPTWGTLSHFGRLGMFATILSEAALLPEEHARLTTAHEVYRRQQIPPSGKDQRAFNAACRDLWQRGWRPEKAA